MSESPKKAMDRAKATIDREVARWKPLMGLGAWVIATYYHRDDASLPKRYRKQAASGYGALMWMRANWEYYDASINVCLHRVAQRTDEELANDVRHELAHIVINEMREHFGKDGVPGGKHEERVVTILAHAFGQTHIAGWNAAKDDLKRRQRKRGDE